MSVTNLHTHARRAFAANVRQAAQHATPEQLHDLRVVTDLVRVGDLSVRDAHRIVSELRAEQREPSAA